jgi:xylan 1,4-beta-xylosidase
MKNNNYNKNIKSLTRSFVLSMMILMTAFCYAQKFTYCNPNNEVLMRDTHVIANPDDGLYYAIGTIHWGSADASGDAGFRLYVSKNLKDWTLGPWIMRQKDIPKDKWYQSLFWAPEIHKINGKWYFTYNCSGNYPYDEDKYCDSHWSGISVADKITGPYRDLSDKPLTPWPSNDMTLFQDDNGKVYALFNNGFFNMDKHPNSVHSIFIAQVNLDNGTLMEKPHKLLTQQDGFEASGIEGSHLVKVKGFYYLFYSGWEGGYCVGYAVSKNIYGPYHRADNSPLFGALRDGALVKNGKKLYGVDHPYREIGHNQVFKGPDGRYWTSCHAYVKNGDNVYGSMLIIDPLNFNDGVITTNAPSWTPQTVKISRQMKKQFPGLLK